MSLTDWISAGSAVVSALGGIGAIAATALLAFNENKRANRLEEMQVDTQYAERHALIDEALRIVEAISHQYSIISSCNPALLGPSGIDQITNDEINAHCDNIEKLRQFTGSNARLYIALGQLAHKCRVPQMMYLHSDNGFRSHSSAMSRNLPRDAKKLLDPLR